MRKKKTYRKLILEIIVEVIGVLKFSINNTASKNGIKQYTSRINIFNNSHPSATSDLVGTTAIQRMRYTYCSKKSSSTVQSPGTCCSGDAGPASIWSEVCMLSIPLKNSISSSRFFTVSLSSSFRTRRLSSSCKQLQIVALSDFNLIKIYKKVTVLIFASLGYEFCYSSYPFPFSDLFCVFSFLLISLSTPLCSFLVTFFSFFALFFFFFCHLKQMSQRYTYQYINVNNFQGMGYNQQEDNLGKAKSHLILRAYT